MRAAELGLSAVAVTDTNSFAGIVRAHAAASHQKIGWETFTDTVINEISNAKDFVVFVLWGASARSKKKLIDTQKHKVVESAHPSPLSAHRGFIGSKPFSQANTLLSDVGVDPVDWNLDLIDLTGA